jgi:hypothetical protein
MNTNRHTQLHVVTLDDGGRVVLVHGALILAVSPEP